MNLELFPEDNVHGAEDLRTRIHECIEIELQHVSISEKWILSSALQKSIRRGLVAQAVSVAFSLHKLDPSYLRRRLPIIALEDIGLGGVGICLDVIGICRAHHFWQQSTERSIAYMVSEMAKARKSRAACDALCWSSVDRDSKNLQSQLQRLSTRDLVDRVINPDRVFVERILCSKILDEQFQRRRSEPGRKQSDVTWQKLVASELNLPEQLLELSRHAKVTAAMACTLPAVFHVAGITNMKTGEAYPRSSELWGGVPLGSLDQYTKIGRLAIFELIHQSPDLQKFATYKVDAPNPIAAISLRLFQIESACLDRYLSSSGLDEVAIGSERAELMAAGVKPEDRHELARLLIAHSDQLADIRMATLRRFGFHDGTSL